MRRGESDMSEAVRAVETVCFRDGRPDGKPETSDVVVEQALTITVEGVGSYTVMCTPTNLKELAAGFAFSEGMIASAGDINLLVLCEDRPDVLRMEIRDPHQAVAQRNMVAAGSGRVCGKRDISELVTAWPRCADSLRVSRALLNGMVEGMRSQQRLFAATGGTHAAAIFSGCGDIVGFGEDIGRHNALDKAIGGCVLTGRSTVGCGVALSGRVSFELVAKAARAGLELMAAVSAPTSLAIDAAGDVGITLCAFVRDDRATVYTHRHRVTG